MNSKYHVCICCAARITKAERRLVTAKSMQLFVAARVFPLHLVKDSYICNKCRMMYVKWKALPDLNGVLKIIDDSDEATNGTIGISGEESSDDDCMNVENNSSQSMDETSSGEESMDDDAGDGVMLNRSLNDNRLVEDESSGDNMNDEESSSDENSEEVPYIRYTL